MKGLLGRTIDLTLLLAFGITLTYIFVSICFFGIAAVDEPVVWIRWTELVVSILIFLYGVYRIVYFIQSERRQHGH